MSAPQFRQDLERALSGAFIIERELAPGGMSLLFVATERATKRRVVLKVLPPELASEVNSARFQREIDLGEQLVHPRILPALTAGMAAGTMYYVMPFVEGESLRDRLDREKQLPIDAAIRIATEVAEAMQFAHAQGVVHRDIKPANILLSANGAIVADFGIARAITRSAGDKVTSAGVAIGTPAYMSPEQASGDGAVGTRSDIYSLGCVTYEMIAGMPPFVAATTEALIAQRFAHRPPELSRHRQSVPAHVEAAVRRALELAPADRFATAGEFANALNDRDGSGAKAARRLRQRGTRRGWIIGVTLVAVVAAIVAYTQLPSLRYGTPDPHRVMIFPLSSANTPAGSDVGEGVATLIGYALEGTAPLRWLDGQDWMPGRGTMSEGAASLHTKRWASLAGHAKYFIDGSVIEDHDSTRVVLRLYDASGDSLVGRSGASTRAGAATPAALGLQAIDPLLLSLLAPGRTVDVSPLSARRPAAIANFLQGERAYRSARFVEALALYLAAVSEDSLFALAALKGAQAAAWHSGQRERDEMERLTALAVRHVKLLPERYAEYALGAQAFQAGRADTALAHFQRALQGDPRWPEAWVGLGEVYELLLPAVPEADTLAAPAFEQARRLDTAFAVPLFYLARIALRHRRLEQASALAEAYARTGPDSSMNPQLRLMLRCARDGPGAMRWSKLVHDDARVVILVAKALSENSAYPACAAAAAGELLRSPGVLGSDRWGALLVLNALLVAQGDDRGIVQLLHSPEASGLPAEILFVLDASAGAGVRDEAEVAVRSKGSDYTRLVAPTLWLVGTWESSRGNRASLDAISRALASKVDSTHARRDSLLLAAIVARAAEASGDTAQAIALMSRLTPTGNDADLEWQPWESLAAERIALGRLLVARGAFDRAEAATSSLDSPWPNSNLLYRRAGLQLRIRAAQGAHDGALETRLTEQLHRLSSGSSPVVSP